VFVDAPLNSGQHITGTDPGGQENQKKKTTRIRTDETRLFLRFFMTCTQKTVTDIFNDDSLKTDNAIIMLMI
jgi:hypothetical protein